ncbi:V-type proton ATPase 116 kDa subunit a 1-like [Centruroides vittatus]|uniref:V-type proton ATPase 116 kDa subunit a 1-like n=1 Tax=Centruroides vittatus TaxID=120091 RepID=UPI003510ABFE
MFRSAEMKLCQLYLQNESAYCCISELGELGLVQFRDVNNETSVLQRKFVNDIRRCDEMERKLRFLETEIKKENIPIFDAGDNPEAPLPKEIIDLEATLEKFETELREVIINDDALTKTFLELTEMKYVLMKAQMFFDEKDHSPSVSEGIETTLISRETVSGGVQLSFMAGVIRRDRIPVFERTLWRLCRGNAFFRQAEIEEPLDDLLSGDKVNKSVFLIFFQGEQLKIKVKKICEGFRATLYPCPESQIERSEQLKGILIRLADISTILNETEDHRHRQLVNTSRNIRNWFIKIRKIKAIYHTLNLFDQDVTRKCLIAECWCAAKDIPKVQAALLNGTEKSRSSMPSILHCISHDEQPPTFNTTNKFTVGFQNIVNAYGVSNYREANPAPYTIITFPFLFAVMFGDAGHGFLMFLFALWMVIKEKTFSKQKSNGEIWNTFFNGRYIILLMGIFSVYTGLIYNDIFSKSINIFGSSWKPINISDEQVVNSLFQLNMSTSYTGHPYPFGLDPVWSLAKNKILFTNSYKMKLSIIFGVSQMLFGVILSAWNHCFFRDYLSLFCDFIPQLLFLLSIFGYLVGLIIAKWLTYYGENNYGCAPSLLIMLINMFLFRYPDSPCYLSNMYSAQPYVQKCLVIIALLCVPWMLLLKPFMLRRQYHSPRYMRQESPHREAEEFDFADVFINQAIHTIEYCLGSISHTASYLRLWALSLAHSQLSEVLWTMVMNIALRFSTNFLGAAVFVPIFFFWAVLTVGVLLIMEGLSAFLHALRLHWVEFQSKFYKGSGYIFAPLCFKTILESEEE